MSAGIAHLIDDDEAIRDALSWLLRSRGIETRSWGSAEGFLADYPEYFTKVGRRNRREAR